MGFLTRCKRLFSFAFLLQNRNTFFSFFLKSFLILSEKQQRRTVENEIAKDAWIIDGNFGSSLELRLSRAQAAVYLDYSRAVCLAGVLRRVWTTHGRVRPDMGAGCPERFDLSFLRWVWDFPKRDGTHVKALLAAHPEVRCVTLKNRRDAQVLLRRLEGADDGSI